MERRKKKQKGITLIALVISIIVMLILAGVSLNMTIGENGIISQAQNATYLNGMAVLEEWLQQKYVQLYDEASDYTNKPELLASKINGLFLKQGNKNYITSSLDGTGVKQYYLINKQALPKEIRDGLKGGNTTEYADYISFIDVYGITEDLKVYYCKDGLVDGVAGEVAGVTISPDTKLSKINTDSAVKSAVISALGLDPSKEVTVGDIQSLKTLTLNNPSISSIQALSEAYGLKKLTLENLNLQNLAGLENCTSLESIYFKGTICGDYSALCSNYNLNTIYMWLKTNWDESVCNTQVSNLCNGLHNASKLTKLKNFGISGEIRVFENQESYRTSYYNIGEFVDIGGGTSKLTDISCFSEINENAQGSIEYLYLHNNNISSANRNIDSLVKFSKLKVFTVQKNANLTNLNGLRNHTSLIYLYANSCYTGNTVSGVTTYTGLSDISALNSCSGLKKVYLFNNLALTNLNTLTGCTSLNTLYAYSCSLTDITGISGLTNLKSLSLYSNVKLNHVSTLATLTGLTNLYLANNEAMDEDEVVLALDDTGILAQCGSNYSIPDKYISKFTGLVGEYILADQNLTDSSTIIQRFLTRNDVTNVKRLDLGGNPQLTDATLQNMLKRMKNLQVLSLRGCTNLASLNFISKDNVTGLYELDLRDTNLTDLSNLNNYAKSLKALIINNYNTDFSKIQTTIQRFSLSLRKVNTSFHMDDIWTSYCNGLILIGDASKYTFGSNCTDITQLSIGQSKFTGLQSGTLDLSNLSKLTTVNLRYAGYSLKLPSGLSTYNHSSGDFSSNLSSCTNLSYVSIDAVNATSATNELNSLIKMPAKLEIARNSVTNLNFITVGNSSQLNEVILGGTRSYLSDASALVNASNLSTLVLGETPYLSDLSFIPKLTKLTYLGVHSSKANSVTAINLVDSTNDANKLSILETLNVYNNENIKNINGMDKISSLISLDIHNTGVSSLKGVSKQTGLTTLNLYGNQISDLTELDELIKNCNGHVGFNTLNLSNNSIDYYSANGNDNVQTILNLRSAGVSTINVSGNTIADSPKLQNISGIIVK